MSSLRCECIYLYGQGRNISFLKNAHWYGQNFLDNYLLIRPENLKTSKFLKIQAQNFFERNVIDFCCAQMVYIFQLLITLCSIPKGLVTQLQGKQQLCMHMLYESLVGNVSIQLNSRVPFDVVLLMQRVQYYQ